MVGRGWSDFEFARFLNISLSLSNRLKTYIFVVFECSLLRKKTTNVGNNCARYIQHMLRLIRDIHDTA